MKALRRPETTERGQSAAIVALVLVGIAGLMAITFDGAHGFFRRRLAQTAADAGALAGARELCVTFGDADAALAVASAYVEEHNFALVDPDTPPLIEGRAITVTTMITYPTTFANMWGVSEMTVRAQAAAGCFLPTAGTSVLPIAFSCEQEIIETEEGEQICGEIEFGTLDGDNGNDPLYIVMDSRSLDDDVDCLSDGGTVDCDTDNDGIDEVLQGGNRSWLDLDGNAHDSGNGSSALCDWIEGGFPNEVHPHMWYGGQPGVSGNLFHNCIDQPSVLDRPMLLPIYDAITEVYPPPNLSGHTDTYTPSNGSTEWFHIITFAWFVPTCVHSGPNKHCPLFDQLVANGFFQGWNGSGNGNNVNTLEGYFAEGHVVGVDGTLEGGINTGVYNVQLIK